MIGTNGKKTLNVTSRLNISGQVVEKTCHKMMKMMNKSGTASV
jgi:hypothetical protein